MSEKEKTGSLHSLRRADLVLIAALLLTALALFCWGRTTRKTGNEVVVAIDGQETARYPLSQDREVEIGSAGGVNLLVIRDGLASVTEADCPDKICVRERPIRYAGEAIICLPHKLVITVAGEEEAEVDAIVQ